MCIFGLFRSVKFVTFIYTFLDSSIIVAIIFDVITAIIGVGLLCFYGIFVAFLIKYVSELICRLIKFWWRLNQFASFGVRINNGLLIFCFVFCHLFLKILIFFLVLVIISWYCLARNKSAILFYKIFLFLQLEYFTVKCFDNSFFVFLIMPILIY